jgi:hypothetical protein
MVNFSLSRANATPLSETRPRDRIYSRAACSLTRALGSCQGHRGLSAQKTFKHSAVSYLHIESANRAETNASLSDFGLPYTPNEGGPVRRYAPAIRLHLRNWGISMGQSNAQDDLNLYNAVETLRDSKKAISSMLGLFEDGVPFNVGRRELLLSVAVVGFDFVLPDGWAARLGKHLMNPEMSVAHSIPAVVAASSNRRMIVDWSK